MQSFVVLVINKEECNMGTDYATRNFICVTILHRKAQCWKHTACTKLQLGIADAQSEHS